MATPSSSEALDVPTPSPSDAALDDDEPSGPTEPSDDTGADPDTPTVLLAVDELAVWVEERSGREFTSPATVMFQDSATVTQEAVERAISVDLWNLWSTLGLVEPTDSRRVAATALLETGKGSCCPARVILGENEFETAFVTVHELAHALDWERVQQRPSLHAIPPLLAAVEGNAHRLAVLWATENGVDEASIERVTSVLPDTQDQRIPTAVRRILTYPYEEGLRFVETIHAERGEAGILDAFDRPPNGAEVLNPQRWLENAQWPVVAAPTELLDAAPSNGGQLGAFMLSLMIEPHVGQAQAHGLVDSWLGDSYVITNSVEQSCVAVRIVVREPEDAAALSAALRNAGGFVDTTGATINFTRCT